MRVQRRNWPGWRVLRGAVKSCFNPSPEVLHCWAVVETMQVGIHRELTPRAGTMGESWASAVPCPEGAV